VLRERIQALSSRGGRILICGGGLTGIEIASELAEAFPGLRIALATSGEFGAGFSPRAADYLRRAFDRLRIQIHENTRIARVGERHADNDTGARIAFDQCIWTGPFSVSPLARDAGFAVNAIGQICTDATLRSVSHPNIFAAGDAATAVEPIGAPLRMACATATAMGAHVADVVWADLNGRSHRPFRLSYLSRNVSLGRRDGVIDWVTAGDNVRNRIWTGRLAALYKRAIGAFVWHAIRAEKHLGATYLAPVSGARASVRENGAYGEHIHV
jgi:NADH dehydrogenase FAD-containing subunit